MKSSSSLSSFVLALALILPPALASARRETAAPAKPEIGKVERWQEGYWSAVPQKGPDGKVRQCTLVAKRTRAGAEGGIDTRLALVISTGAGFVMSLGDDKLPREDVLDDRAEMVIDGTPLPSVGFPVENTFVFHPGDAAAALRALKSATRVTLRSTGAGIDSGAIALDLPAAPLAWLERCGATFDIAIDRPTDPKAPPLPAPRPPSPQVLVTKPTPAGPAGIEDKQKIAGWDASELRNPDGRVIVCMIRRHYVTGSEADARRLGVFMMASRLRGLSMMFKDSELNQPGEKPIEATLAADGKPFTDFKAQTLGPDEVGLFPTHGPALANAIDGATNFELKLAPNRWLFPVGGALPWLRACARRHGILFEAPPKD